jgi:hypothetical protein
MTENADIKWSDIKEEYLTPKEGEKIMSILNPNMKGLNYDKYREHLDTEEKVVCFSLLSKEEQKKALKDEDYEIRLEAYRRLGFTEEAFKDDFWLIRMEAETYFKMKDKFKC